MTQLTCGSPYPPGSHYDGQGVNFSLFSAHGERVDLCLFDCQGNETRLTLPCRTGSFWHGYLPDATPGLLYGYRVHGPWAPLQGLRFNPAKLLIDPYSREVRGILPDSPLLSDGGDQPDPQDSATAAPKSVVVGPSTYDWQHDAPPHTPWCNTLIYEAHVRGFTLNHPEIPLDLRGSYAALAHPVILHHLQRLGVTALELMPIQCHVTEPRLQRLGLTNYWGYNVLAPFAVAADYWSGRPGTTPLSELQDAVKALHTTGIEVILDVVFNHTAELDFEGDGPTVAQRGIDNSSYYWLDEQGNYLNWSGCGNQLRLDKAETIQWVLDCLRYWVSECHIDGFRFDLAPQLGRIPNFSANAPLFCALRQDPLLARCKLIAEPWDMGPGGYQLGYFPYPFAEWNDRFRDDIRRFWLQGDVTIGQFAQRFAASSHYFQHNGRLPSSSINLLTAHDGFTLQDLVSFNYKHNQANGEDNRDGHSDNFSYNHGIEGSHADEATRKRRRDSQHALLTTLLLAQGTPQLLCGDEFGHSQNGNNNSYCQDNAISWLDWQTADHALCEFTENVIALRKQIAALNSRDWWQEGEQSVQWLDAQAQPVSNELWQQLPPPPLQILLSTEWLLIVNGGQHAADITLPAGRWEVRLNTVSRPTAPSSPSAVWSMVAKSITVLRKK